jgi:hypothetical protein
MHPGLDWSGSGLAQVESSCEFDDEPSGSIKWGNCRVASQLVASRVVLSSIELVKYSLTPIANSNPVYGQSRDILREQVMRITLEPTIDRPVLCLSRSP